MSARRPQSKPGSGGRPPSQLSRRRFVALAGAGLAALSAAGPALGAPAPAKTGGAAKPKKPAEAGAAHPAGATPPPAPTPQQKEFERQRTGTLSALKTIRAYPLPPGGDLPVVFKPMRESKKER